MYRHILVPIDNTDLATETVSRAVAFAGSIGARITFFHAQADYSASLRGEAEVVRATAPADFAYAYQGKARELLAKAESAARAQGVPCASSSTVNDTPYRAIIAAAGEAGCDLIFMASHGRRSKLGMVLGSHTLKVLTNAGMPVLVSSTSNPPAPVQAIGIIRDEHRSLAAVLHAWQRLLHDAEQDGTDPDPVVMRAMIHYIREFPVALHHPKEERHLFRKLRERTTHCNAELDELERQHERDLELVDELAALVKAQAAGDTGATEIRQAVSRYASFIWEHMGREEGVILTAAQRHLTAEDWDEINAAFCTNQDPRFGADTDAEFRRLFSRIVNLAAPASSAADEQ